MGKLEDKLKDLEDSVAAIKKVIQDGEILHGQVSLYNVVVDNACLLETKYTEFKRTPTGYANSKALEFSGLALPARADNIFVMVTVDNCMYVHHTFVQGLHLTHHLPVHIRFNIGGIQITK